jgi:hypothetical protein
MVGTTLAVYVRACVVVGSLFSPATLSAQGESVEDLLRQDSSLVTQHEAYLKLLAEHPDLHDAEQSWWSLKQIEGFRTVAAKAETALVNDTQWLAHWRNFYDTLAQNPALEKSVNAVEDLARRRPALVRALETAWDFFLTHPEAAQHVKNALLQSAPLPAAIERIRRESPELFSRLAELLQALPEKDSAASPLWAYWRMQYQSAPDTPYGAFLDELRRYPLREQTWHIRNLTLARYPQDRNFVLSWHARIGEHPTLSAVYPAYIVSLLSSEQRTGQFKISPSPRRPGENTPEPIATAPLSDILGFSAASPESPKENPAQVEKPQVIKPRRPDMPQKPAMPQRPAKPLLRRAP